MSIDDALERATRTRRPTEIWTDAQFLEARERDLAERTLPARTAVVAVLGCLLLAALLASGKIVELAERQEFGPARDRNLSLAEGVDRVSNFFSLNRPYDAIRELRDANNERDEAADVVPADSASQGSPQRQEADSEPASTPTVEPETPQPIAPAAPSPQPTRSVSDSDPLRVYVAGDSQATYLGQAITSERGELALDVTVDDVISTSLARPDYFDWPARWVEQVDRLDPELVVVFLGANDHQDMADSDGQRLVEGTEHWRLEWRRRLVSAFDLLTTEGRQVYWVTQPPMRDSGLNGGVMVINEIAADVIASRNDVVSIDIWELFGGSGPYRERLDGSDGTTITARVSDGVHLSRPAASWVADLVFAEMLNTWTFN